MQINEEEGATCKKIVVEKEERVLEKINNVCLVFKKKKKVVVGILGPVCKIIAMVFNSDFANCPYCP